MEVEMHQIQLELSQNVGMQPHFEKWSFILHLFIFSNQINIP